MSEVKNKKTMPMFTSCCPAWVNYIEHHYPDLLHLPSSCKSPQNMFGAMAKHYLAPKMDIEPKDMIVVSVMPCIAKKYEASRPEFSRGLNYDVDYVITTRELSSILKKVKTEKGLDKEISKFFTKEKINNLFNIYKHTEISRFSLIFVCY